MKFFPVFLSGIIILSQSVALAAEVADNHGIYYVELEAFKKAPETKMIFDEDAHSGLSNLLITIACLGAFQNIMLRCR